MEAVWTARRVTHQLGRSDCIVRRCHLYIYTRKPGSGRPRQINRREDRHIVSNSRVQPTASSADIEAEVAPSLWEHVSSRTVPKCLAE
ncbi:transposable element Tcb2 transposase [Trichonephila clavipes]|nr:transposable element Tcb2 transposase [Trichonephila clavipes]